MANETEMRVPISLRCERFEIISRQDPPTTIFVLQESQIGPRTDENLQPACCSPTVYLWEKRTSMNFYDSGLFFMTYHPQVKGPFQPPQVDTEGVKH